MAAGSWLILFFAVRGEEGCWRSVAPGDGVLADVRCAEILADLRGE